jgi:hypothetical protein
LVRVYPQINNAGKMRDDMQYGGNPDLVRCKLLLLCCYLKLLVAFKSLFLRRIIPSLSGTNQFDSTFIGYSLGPERAPVTSCQIIAFCPTVRVHHPTLYYSGVTIDADEPQL